MLRPAAPHQPQPTSPSSGESAWEVGRALQRGRARVAYPAGALPGLDLALGASRVAGREGLSGARPPRSRSPALDSSGTAASSAISGEGAHATSRARHYGCTRTLLHGGGSQTYMHTILV